MGWRRSCSHRTTSFRDIPWRNGDVTVTQVTLAQGDLLYLPRGFVHEAAAARGGFSTHLTLSTYQVKQ